MVIDKKQQNYNLKPKNKRYKIKTIQNRLVFAKKLILKYFFKFYYFDFKRQFSKQKLLGNLLLHSNIFKKWLGFFIKTNYKSQYKDLFSVNTT